jgi:hypothetical protein
MNTVELNDDLIKVGVPLCTKEPHVCTNATIIETSDKIKIISDAGNISSFTKKELCELYNVPAHFVEYVQMSDLDSTIELYGGVKDKAHQIRDNWLKFCKELN